MAGQKKYDIFISFAEPDRQLAKNLNDLFLALSLKAFFAPKDLPKDSPSDWQKGILEKGLKQSRSFLPIFTHQSLNRRWVLFEAGAAAALKLNFFIACVDGIEDKDVDLFPYAHHQIHFKLFNEDDIKNLLLNIFKVKKTNKKSEELFHRRLDGIFSERKELISSIICEARRQWVFIAGNIPKPQKNTSSSNIKDEMKELTASITTKLIEAGFNISACPQVPYVGKVALETAEKWIGTGKSCPITGCEVDYEIAGIYPIDQELRTTTLNSKKITTRWKEHLLEFRKSYLNEKDWLILIGGNEGTIEEFDALEAINESRFHGIKVCFVTHFGGSTKKLWSKKIREDNSIYFDGCKGWSSKNENMESLAENIVKIISEN